LINALEKRLDSTFFNPTEELYLSLEPYEAKAKLFCLEFGNSSHHMSYFHESLNLVEQALIVSIRINCLTLED
jgi:hypothetical protein